MERMNTNWMKREVAEHLLLAAGALIEFWGDDPGRAEIETDFARKCIARWLKDLPGGAWDIRLGPDPYGEVECACNRTWQTDSAMRLAGHGDMHCGRGE